MARLNTIAIGPGRGSAGDATYRKTRGRTVMSARIKENPSNTALQQEQRRLFGGFSTALANQPWFVANFSKSKYGSEINHLQHLNRVFWQSPTFGDMITNDDFDENFLEEMCSRTWHLGFNFYFAHGEAEFYNSSPRRMPIYGVDFLDIVISANEALKPGASLAIRGKIKVNDMDENDVNAVFRLRQTTADVWGMIEGELEDFYANDRLPFYVDGAGLAHVVMPFNMGSVTAWVPFSPQWKELKNIGFFDAHGLNGLPCAFFNKEGTFPDFRYDWGIVMMHINGKPVTYYKPGDVINTQEAPAVAAAPAKAPKKKAKKAVDEEAEK